MITDKYKYVSMDAVKEILRQVELDRERDVIFLPYVVEIPKWIPVTERLPGNTGSVLITKRVLVDVTVVDIGCYFESDKTWYTNDFAVADVERDAGMKPMKSNSTDLISRRAAIDVIDKIFPADPIHNEYTQGITCGVALAMEFIKQLPSVKPEAKPPKWVAEDRYVKNHFKVFPHCPQCNAEVTTGQCYCMMCGQHIDWSEDDE